MSKKLLSLLLSFLILGFVSSFAQEEEGVEEQSYRNPSFTQGAPQSIFEDGQPIFNSDWEWLHQTPQGNTLRWVKMWNASTWYAVGDGGTFIKTTDGGASWTVSIWINGGGSTNSNYDLYDAHFFDLTTGVAVGQNGKIVRTTDAGLNWTIIDPSGATGTFYDVFFLNASVGYACGSTSVDMWKTTDAGITWTGPIVVPGTAYSVYAVDEDTIYHGSSSGNFRRSTDGGATWTTINVGMSSTLYGMNFTDPFNGWVSGTGNNPSYTTDGGLTWTVTAASPTTSTQYDIDILGAGPRPDDLATVYPQSVNYWTGTTDGVTKTDTSEIRGLDSEDGWGMFDVSSIPDGSTIDSIIVYGYVNATNWPYWSLTPLPGLDPRTASASDLKTAIEANSGSGVAYVFRDEGSGFTTGWTGGLMGNTANADLEAALTQDWFAMGMDSRDNSASYYINFDGWAEANVPYLEVYYTPPGVETVYLTGDAFNIFSTTDMGTTWSPVDFLGAQPWTGTYYSTDFLADDNFVTTGYRGQINEVTPTPPETATSHTTYLKGGISFDVWAQGVTGRVISVGAATTTTSFDQGMYSTDGGETWAISTMLDSADRDMNKLSMVDPLIGYTAGEDHRVMKTTDGGATWFKMTDPITSTTDLETCSFVDENNGYVFGSGGRGYKTTDGGTTWTTLTTGMGSSTIYGSFFHDVNTGYICGSSGKLFYTSDGGTTFTQLTSNNTSTLRSIDMVDINVGYVSGSSGKVRKTTDAGVTWDTVDVGNSSPTLYEIEFRNEMNGMTVGSSGRTFYTNDGGATWNFENSSMGTIYGLGLDKTSTDTIAAYICGFSCYIMRNSHVLVPVELASFTASVNGNNVTLNWMTATELNNIGFQVDRRAEEQSWENVGFVNGHGTTTEPQIYNFTDAGLAPGIYNYRIKQMDYDGSYKYYQLEQEVEIGTPESYDLSQNYPNPFNPTTKITYSVPFDGFVNIAIFNVLGEKVANLVNTNVKAGNYELTFDASRIASGVYLYRMEAGDFVSIKKMILLR